MTTHNHRNQICRQIPEPCRLPRSRERQRQGLLEPHRRRLDEQRRRFYRATRMRASRRFASFASRPTRKPNSSSTGAGRRVRPFIERYRLCS